MGACIRLQSQHSKQKEAAAYHNYSLPKYIKKWMVNTAWNQKIADARNGEYQ